MRIKAFYGEEYARYNAQYVERERVADSKLQEVRDVPGIMLDEILSKGGI